MDQATRASKVAEMLARQKEPGARLGKNWMIRFLKDHVGLARGHNRSFESNRIEATIPEMISGWYTHVDEVIQRYNIHPQDQWNMDEIGFQMSHSQNESVVSSINCK